MHDIDVIVTGGTLPEEEKKAYLDRALAMYGKEHILKRMELILDEKDPENIGIKYTFVSRPFDRIRRITGYLVGSLDRWNSAKQAEEHDRVKHAEKPHDHCGDCSNYNSDGTHGIGWCAATERNVWQTDEACHGFKK